MFFLEFVVLGIFGIFKINIIFELILNVISKKVFYLFFVYVFVNYIFSFKICLLRIS